MTTNANGLVACCQDFGKYCINLSIFEVIAIVILTVCVCQVIRRKQFFQQARKRKSIIYALIIACLACNILLNIAQKTLLILYFFQLYVYYLFLIYIVYYFARKAVKINSQKPQKLNHITIYCCCLALLFTIFLIWNIYDYISSLHGSYQLCQSIQQIFHIIRMIGFLVDVVLIGVAHSLNFTIKKNLALNSTILSNFIDFEQYCHKVNKQRIQFWYKLFVIRILVVLTFLGQTLYFVEDIYFLCEGPSETCNIYSDLLFSEAKAFEYGLLVLIVLVQIYLPFSMTIYMFWFKKPEIKQESKSIEVGENYYKTIKQPPKTDSNNTEQMTTLKE